MLVEARQDFLKKIEHRESEVERQLAFLRRFLTPRSVFLHVGASDCALALQAAGFCERVYAYGVQDGLTSGVRLPLNLRLGIPREPVDVAFSEGFEAPMAASIHRWLAPGGRYFFYVNGDYRQARRTLREAGYSDSRFPFLLSVFQRQRMAAGVR